MSTSRPDLRAQDLAALDAAILHALETDDESALQILGYGEISCVVKWSSGDESFACKRLPPFEDTERFEAYRVCVEEYLETLAARGVHVVPSNLASVAHSGGRLGAYLVQPMLPAGSLLPRRLAELDEDEGRALVREVFDRIVSVVDGRVGFDGQLSNWAHVDSELLYLDVTTPLMRDERGRERLDTELFLASLPWALRPIVRTFMLRSILETYYQPRRVVVDLLANLIKERLVRHLPSLIDEANRVVKEPITQEEVRRYYDGDARTWALLQRLRRIDRGFQRRVLRRVYPFLLPGTIER